MADDRLTLADQVLVNAMSYLTTVPGGEPENMTMTIAAIREVLVDCSDEHPRMAPLCAAAERMLSVQRVADLRTRSNAFAAAAADARRALSRIYLHRAGAALDRIRDSRKGETKGAA